MVGKHAVKAIKTDFGPKKNRRRIYIFGLFGLWILLVAVVGAALYLTLARPKPKVITATVTIPRGYTSAQIADRLAERGLISSAFTFRLYASFNRIDDRLLPGSYVLHSNMTYDEIAAKLTTGPKKKYIKVVIPEGFTLKEINERLARLTSRPVGEFTAVTEGAFVKKYDYKFLPDGAANLEGYLFPKTYVFEKKTSPKKIINRLLYQFQLETNALDWSPATARGLGKNEIVTIASLIEKEAKVPEERPLMAAVIYNRLALGMPLQIDASVQYVLPERKIQLTIEDTKVDSPYNTYLRQGLPPGPVANPGFDSIKAALNPAPVDYLYYVLTSPDGRHTFTNNPAEFEAAKKRMVQ